MQLKGNWNYPTSIRFGAVRIGELPDACRTLGMHRPLLVTDPALAKLPMVMAAARACTESGLGCVVSTGSTDGCWAPGSGGAGP